MNEASEREVSDLLKKIFMPSLLILGLIGNGLSIVIFSQPSMRKYTTFRYLTFISILDLGSLYTGCGPMVLQVYFDLDIRVINQVTCKMTSFIVYFFTHSSSMLLALMSVDRTIAITIQIGKILSTPKTATKLFIAIVILIALLNAHFLIFPTLVDIEYESQAPPYMMDANCSSIPGRGLADTVESLALASDQQLSTGAITPTDMVASTTLPTTFNVENTASLQGNYLNNCSRNLSNLTNPTTVFKYCYAVAETPYYVYLTKYFTW